MGDSIDYEFELASRVFTGSTYNVVFFLYSCCVKASHLE